jgi:hypothetical protein
MDVDGLRLPDFIIAGAPRTATTWLYALADCHPDIAMAKPVRPEPKFFLTDELYARGVRHYAQTWFAGLPADRTLGEKSTNYLESPMVAERMRAVVPQVKLIFLLRNPIDRAYSNYLWTRMNGLETEEFGRALELETEREASLPERLRYARPYSYFSRGLYAQHLRRFFDLFPREQILILRSEDVGTRPREVALACHQFLGVPPRPDDADALCPINSAVDPQTQPLDRAVYAELARRYAGPNRELAALLGPDFELWPEG